jgi:hypothetical protein
MAFGTPQRLVTLPDGRVADPIYPLALNNAGYAPNVYSTVLQYPSIVPWYYRNTYNPGQISSYLSPTLFSYLPPIITIHH